MTIRKVFFFLLIFASGLCAFFFLGRNAILHCLLEKAAERLNSKYNFSFFVGYSGFNGLSEIVLDDISIVTPSKDSILNIHQLRITPAYFRFLLGKVAYHHLDIDRCQIHFMSSDSFPDNAKQQNRKNDEEKTATPTEINYGDRMNNLFNKIFELITGETRVNDLSVEYRSVENFRRYLIPAFYCNGKEYSCEVLNLSQKDTIAWKVNGTIFKKEKGIQFRMCRISDNQTMVSLTGEKKSLKWLVDTLNLEIKGSEYNDGRFRFIMLGSFSNFLLNYWRVSPDLVGVSNVFLNFIINAGPDYLEIDTTSHLLINKFQCQVGLRYDKSNGKSYSMEVNTGEFPAPNLFESLPKGMFSNLQGIKTKGFLNYHLRFQMNRENPDSLLFDSELKKRDFGIIRFGNDNLARINSEFLYTAYDADKPIRTFPVGSSNPDFTPYGQISDYLKNAVMTSEDGSFYLHGGFNEEAFRQSIATNFKEGRFARGGSTISMQLVKNVFLSRDKTISRKLEEALIVWLIEKNRLVSKERMFEVYLNIIEWGPDVYGIKEASRYYFSKLPSQLTLAESIFLASIIPHPKYYKFSFDQSGQLKPFLAGYYRLVTDRMLRKNWITPMDTINLRPWVQLSGLSLQYILPPDSILKDSIPTPELDFIN